MQTFLEGKDLHLITLFTLCIEDFLLKMQYKMSNANNRTTRKTAGKGVKSEPNMPM